MEIVSLNPPLILFLLKTGTICIFIGVVMLIFPTRKNQDPIQYQPAIKEPAKEPISSAVGARVALGVALYILAILIS